MRILGCCIGSVSGLELSGFFDRTYAPVSRGSRSPLLSTACSTNGAFPMTSLTGNLPRNDPRITADRSGYLFQTHRTVAEESVETPLGKPSLSQSINNNQSCGQCESKGLVRCITCAGSGLYIDSILESQGIIKKVKCLGCGGSGSILCSSCGGRGHV